MGAGILPVAEFNNTLYFLFGLEYKDEKWGDFGGTPEKNESIFDTAIREGYEELDGFLGSKANLKKMVNDYYIDEFYSTDNKYCSHLFEIQYDPFLPFYFNNHHKFIEKHFQNIVDKCGYFEKREMRWFTLQELKKEKQKFRPFYKSIVQQIINNHSKIHRLFKI